MDLSREMADLLGAFGAPTPGRGRVVQFLAAAGGDGTSTVAREFAALAAERSSRPAWLIDLDLLQGGQYAALSAEPNRFGNLQGPAPSSPDGSSFFTVHPPLKAPDGRPWPAARYLSAYAAMERKLWITRFRTDALAPGQSVRINRSPAYWEGLRRHADWIVVDAPAADRSAAALALAAFVDATVLVVAAESADARAHTMLRDELAAAGGWCAGIVFNRARVEPPRFLRALLG